MLNWCWSYYLLAYFLLSWEIMRHKLDENSFYMLPVLLPMLILVFVPDNLETGVLIGHLFSILYHNQEWYWQCLLHWIKCSHYRIFNVSLASLVQTRIYDLREIETWTVVMNTRLLSVAECLSQVLNILCLLVSTPKCF